MATRGILTEMSNEHCRSPLIDPVMSRINVFNNTQESLLSSPHSPDEIVIQQRGRRNIPVIFTSNSDTASLVIFTGYFIIYILRLYCLMVDLMFYLGVYSWVLMKCLNVKYL